VRKLVGIRDKSEKELDGMRQRAQAVAGLDHPGIVKLHECDEDKQNEQLVVTLEYLPGGSCVDLLKQSGGLEEAMVARLIHQLLETLDYCHSRGLVHSGVCPSNILLTHRDFNRRRDCKLATYKTSKKAAAGSMTPYLAPELVDHGSKSATPKADIWAVGVVAFELLSGTTPFGRPAHHGGDPNPVLNRIRRYVSFQDLEQTLTGRAGSRLSVEAQSFLRRLLVADPESRPSADVAARHSWLRQHWTAPSGLSRDVLQSIAGFSVASDLERRCVLAVASWTNREDLHPFLEIFSQMDIHRKDYIVVEDLKVALLRSQGWWLPQLDPEAVFRAMDVDQHGAVKFNAFAAACVHGQLAPLDGWLADEVFDSLDRDKDGLIRTEDVAPFFRGRMPLGLPQNRAVHKNEWRALLSVGEDDSTLSSFKGMVSRTLSSLSDFHFLPTSQEAPKCSPGNDPFCTFLSGFGLEKFYIGCVSPPPTAGVEEVVIDDYPFGHSRGKHGSQSLPLGPKGLTRARHQPRIRRHTVGVSGVPNLHSSSPTYASYIAYAT
jgi:Ca2+-binding EF-hand superfamily protein